MGIGNVPGDRQEGGPVPGHGGVDKLGETLSGKAYHGLQGTSVPHGCPG